jgi:hypothetical protein
MFKVGQVLWFVPTGKKQQPSEVTVTKVGRLWTHVGERFRFDESGRVDGGDFQSPGHCYISREAYELEQTRNEAWRKFHMGIANKQIPEHLTIEALAEISAILGI